MAWCKVAVVICIVVVLTKCESISNSDNESPICDEKCKSSSIKYYHKQNRMLKLICRDDNTLVVGIENELGEAQVIEKMGETYMLTIYNKDETTLPPKSVYLINEPIVKIENLKSNTSYNISANLLNEDYQYTAKHNFIEFRTLEENYIPGNITNIYLEDFTLSANGDGVNVVVTWDPSVDKTCFYNLFFHSIDSYESMTFIERKFSNPEQLYRHEMKDLAFGMEYAIGIQALNTNNSMLQSEIWWHVITTPSCMEWFKDNVTICAPFSPENVTVVAEMTSENRSKFIVSWNAPAKYPDHYTIDIIDFESGLRQIFNISNGTSTSAQFTDVEVKGLDFDLFVTAHSAGGDSSTVYSGKLDYSKMHQPPAVHQYSTLQILAIVAYITGPLLAFLVILILKFNLNQRAKSFLMQNRDNCF